MSLLPVIERELRVAARPWRTQRNRMLVVATAAVAVTVLAFVSAMSPGGSFGSAFFRSLAGFAFLFCLYEGARTTADCISHEKREGTLGLLFLTDLRGYEVILGKFASTSLRSFYSLLAVFPLLAVPVLVGGVTGAEFWRMNLVLLAALFLSVNVGILVSTLHRDERRAWASTIVALVGLWALPWLIDSALARWWTGQQNTWLRWCSPKFAFQGAFDLGYQVRPEDYWGSLGAALGLGGACLVLASLLLPHTWQEQPKTAENWNRPRWWEFPGRPAASVAERHRLLTINPVFWLTARRRRPVLLLWTYALVVLAIWCSIGTGGGGIGGSGSSLMFALLPGFSTLTYVMSLPLLIWLGAQTCYSVADARRDGALELLLVTPLTAQEIVRGQYLALRRQFLGPLLVIGCSQGAIPALAMLLSEPTRIGSLDASIILGGISALVTVGILILDLLAVGTVAMWFGLSDPKPTQALAKTFLLVIVVPSLFCFCFAPRLITDVGFFFWARNRLLLELRRTAAERA